MKITRLKGDLSAPRTIELDTFVKEIRRETPARIIQEIRENISYMSHLRKPAYTEKVPAVIFSSLYKGKEWTAYTGLILIEFNQLGSRKETELLKEQVVRFTEPLLVFTGLTGQSVKIVVRYTLPDGCLPQQEEAARLFHLQAYRKAAAHFQLQLNQAVTQRPPDLNQTCRFSWDRECYYNPESPAIRMEQPTGSPEELVHKTYLPAAQPTDLLAGILPGMEQYEKISRLFEECLKTARGEEGGSWEEEDPKSFLIVLARYCCRSSIPEENTTRWIYAHRFPAEDLSLIRATVHNVYLTEKGKPLKPVLSHPTNLLMQMEEFLERRYELRKNVINGEMEYREKHAFSFYFKPVTPEILNGICLEAQQEGIQVWDKDIRRYIYSPRVEVYNPLQEFCQKLPRWDKTDRIRPLADRIPTNNPLWRERFYKWFISMVAQWIRHDKIYANSLVPVLQGGQGTSKSVFFRLLLPPELRDYYAESIHLENKKEAELTMAQHVLINLDEFDRLSKKFQADLKHLIQKPVLKIRPPHQKSFQRIKRIASFCATANPEELLSDPTGSRRYICVQVLGPIDIQTPFEYEQIYAQAQQAVRSGETYWFTPEEEQALMRDNMVFQHRSMLIEYLFSYFRVPDPEETGQPYTAMELIDHISKRSKRTFSNTSVRQFGMELRTAGLIKKHTKRGNVYYLIEIDE